MGWQFAAILIGARLASIALSLWQHSRYRKVVNEMARANAGRRLRLVSGRAKGRLRGAVAVLLVDPAAGEVVEARAMVGSTIFARLRPAPELAGPVSDVVARAGPSVPARPGRPRPPRRAASGSRGPRAVPTERDIERKMR
ncbi:MAG: transcriptional regulator [Actinobacteria bacterium]|nr:transcriptional regulator [Actinomycetota bacterium]